MQLLLILNNLLNAAAETAAHTKQLDTAHCSSKPASTIAAAAAANLQQQQQQTCSSNKPAVVNLQ